MGRKTHGPYVIAAIELNDIQKISDIFTNKFRDKSKVKSFLISEVRRLASEYTEIPLFLAAGIPDPTIIRYMVQKHEANINYVHEYGFQTPKKRKTALLEAVRRCLYTTVDAIIMMNADVNIQDHKGRTPLHHAIRRADYRMVKLLVTRGAQVGLTDISGNSPLHISTIYGHAELIKLLMKYGGDLYKKGQHGAIPLHMAAREGHASILKMICEYYDINSNTRVPCYNELEKSPLHVAASQGHGETVWTMLENCKSDVNLQDSEGNSPLHYVVLEEYDSLGMKTKEDFTETVKVLLNFGANVNTRNARGETALHLAARSEFQKIIEVLVLAGCDPLIEDNDKNKAIDLVTDDDTVSKQFLKNALLNRDKLMHEAIDYRTRSIPFNFARNIAPPSQYSQSSINLSALHNNSRSHIHNNSYGSNYGMHKLTNQAYNSKSNTISNKSYSSSGSSKKECKESIYSGSKISASVIGNDPMAQLKSRKARSVENLDQNKKKSSKAYNSKSDNKNFNSARKNSYQESVVTSMWDATPSSSLRDLQPVGNYQTYKQRKTYKKSKNSRMLSDNYISEEGPEDEMNNDDIRVPMQFLSNKHKKQTSSITSEDYYLDDDDSVDMLEDNEYNNNKIPKTKKKIDLIDNWVNNQTEFLKKSKKNKSKSRIESDDSDETSSTESDSDDTEISIKEPTKKPPTFLKPKKNNNYSKNSIDQVIQLEVDETGKNGQTTITVIPVNPYGNSKSQIIPKGNSSLTQVNLNPKQEFKHKTDKEILLKNEIVKNDQTSKLNPIAKQRKNLIPKSNDISLKEEADNKSQSQLTKSENLINKPVLNKKPVNLIFARAPEQSIDNLQVSNLARLSVESHVITPSTSSFINLDVSPNKNNQNKSFSTVSTISKKTNNSTSSETTYFNTDKTEIQTNKVLNKNSAVRNKIIKNDNSAEESENEVEKKLILRTVSYPSNGELSFTLVGGNEKGIFVHAVDYNSAASRNGLLSGDQILKINDKVIFGLTKEEVDEKLHTSEGHITLIVTKQTSKCENVVKDGGSGDLLFLKAHFDYDTVMKSELNVKEGNIFCVLDTCPEGYSGYYKAKLMAFKKEDQVEGLIPNQKRADNILSKQKLFSSKTDSYQRGGNFMRSFKKSKSTERLDRNSNSIDDEISNCLSYERVSPKVASVLRPVVILGLFCDVVINYLIKDNPNMFSKPEDQFENIKLKENPVDIKLLEMAVSKGKHVLLILSPPSIEYVIKKFDINPIIIYLSPVSKIIVKGIKAKLAPNYNKDANYMFEEAMKFENNFKHLFTATVNYTLDEWWFHNLKEAISQIQSQPTWKKITNYDIDEIIYQENLRYFPNNSKISKEIDNNKIKELKRLSKTTEDLVVTSLTDFSSNNNLKEADNSSDVKLKTNPTENLHKKHIQPISRNKFKQTFQTHETPL